MTFVFVPLNRFFFLRKPVPFLEIVAKLFVTDDRVLFDILFELRRVQKLDELSEGEGPVIVGAPENHMINAELPYPLVLIAHLLRNRNDLGDFSEKISHVLMQQFSVEPILGRVLADRKVKKYDGKHILLGKNINDLAHPAKVKRMQIDDNEAAVDYPQSG